MLILLSYCWFCYLLKWSLDLILQSVLIFQHTFQWMLSFCNFTQWPPTHTFWVCFMTLFNTNSCAAVFFSLRKTYLLIMHSDIYKSLSTTKIMINFPAFHFYIPPNILKWGCLDLHTDIKYAHLGFFRGECALHC